MTATHTEKRINKLFKRGLDAGQIARKIGRPDDVERVLRVIQNDSALLPREQAHLLLPTEHAEEVCSILNAYASGSLRYAADPVGFATNARIACWSVEGRMLGHL